MGTGIRPKTCLPSCESTYEEASQATCTQPLSGSRSYQSERCAEAICYMISA